jgi:hypothetical protein
MFCFPHSLSSCALALRPPTPAPRPVCHHSVRGPEKREENGRTHPFPFRPQVPLPVLRWGSAAQRTITTIPGWNEQTTLCSVFLDGETIEIGTAFVRKLLRHTCAVFGGFKTFGFHPLEIGNKSLRSGAAMSLFLMDHSPAKIMILGRWSSDAFLVCVRPQVLEWTNHMSCSMIHLDSFFDAPHRDLVAPDDPRTRKRLQAPFYGRDNIVTIPKFCIHC